MEELRNRNSRKNFPNRRWRGTLQAGNCVYRWGNYDWVVGDNFPWVSHLSTFSCEQVHWLLTEAEVIKKRWQEYAEELYKNDPHDPDNHSGVITHLEPDILECQLKWALGSITRNKASGGDGIPIELFQVLKDDGVKVLHSIYQQIWKTQQWPQDWKRSVFILVPKKGNAKECSDYSTIPLVSHTSKVMLKILQARLQQYINRELPGVQAGFRKGRGTRDQIANIWWIIEK